MQIERTVARRRANYAGKHWSQVSSQTPAGGAVELHQVGVRNPMADDREKGFSDVNLGV